ncbi:Uncharacterized protein C17orf62 [Trichoplax sp. H2]|nr:Uncharacterized protein C17orf62 [Trichoplax sp. H2]|eukprot:RDD37499.1 Uncharacterized protein C17orf62 [Trichoplax sp. H2]
MYLRIDTESKETLILSRYPSTRSWMVSFFIALFGLFISYYSSDGSYLKLTYTITFVIIALMYLDYWEQCVFDKHGCGTITLKSQSLMQRLFNLPYARYIIANISEIQEVTVEHDNVRYFGMSHQVMLHFSPGYSLPLTNNSTFGDCSKHYKIAEKISEFLQIKCEL